MFLGGAGPRNNEAPQLVGHSRGTAGACHDMSSLKCALCRVSYDEMLVHGQAELSAVRRAKVVLAVLVWLHTRAECSVTHCTQVG